MSLPLAQPFLPMEAKSAAAIPIGSEWEYEPKWDGFRCLVFRDGDSIELQSKSGKPLTRYFPEVVQHLDKLPAPRFVLDAELVIPVDGQLSFDERELIAAAGVDPALLLADLLRRFCWFLRFL